MTEKTPDQKQFIDFAFRRSLSLNLTKPMIEMLCAAAEDVEWDRSAFGSNLSYPDNWYATEKALSARGLLERKPMDQIREERPMDGRHHVTAFVKLTPVGKALVDFLKAAGIFIVPYNSYVREGQELQSRANVSNNIDPTYQ